MSDHGQLADDLLAVVLDSDPIAGSLYGLPGYDDKLPDLSAQAETVFADRFAAIAAGVAEVATEGLSEGDRQTVDFLAHTAADLAAATRVPLIEWTVSDIFVSPIPSLFGMLPQLPHDSVERAEGYLARLRDLPGYVREAGARHRDGLAAGRPPVARLVTGAVAHLDRLLGSDALGLLREAPEGWPTDRDLAAEQRVLLELTADALREYRALLVDELLPAARDDDHPGLVHLPGGPEFYAVLSRHHSSTDRSPEDLHATGLALVEALHQEFAEVGQRAFGTSDLAEIFRRLREDPALRYTTSAEMVEQAQAAVKRAESAAPQWFGSVPQVPCAVVPVPEVEAAGAPPAYYLPGSMDGSRAGTYFVNTSDPGERYRSMAETVAFHEAVPGHHFQLTIAMEIEGLPLARRLLRDTACTEGWGLYAERLADEMGLYSDDVARLGMLAADAWRAGRLVVDTGLHAQGWSRQQAFDWFVENTPIAVREISSEVDRYIAYPAQALSYMVGRLEIQRLRAFAAAALGDRFDVKAFHDHVLAVGPLPLATLAATVERWVDAQR